VKGETTMGAVIANRQWLMAKSDERNAGESRKFGGEFGEVVAMGEGFGVGEDG
jgi:hypothetical protein